MTTQNLTVIPPGMFSSMLAALAKRRAADVDTPHIHRINASTMFYRTGNGEHANFAPVTRLV